MLRPSDAAAPGEHLTPRQAAFVREYLVDLNGTQAATRAGYSPKTAEEQAVRLLGNVRVSAAISKAMHRRAERVEVKADEVLRELLRLALADVGEAFQADGRLKPIHEMPSDMRRAISGVEAVETEDGGTLRKVRFWDKTRALEMLGRHLALFTDKLEHSGKDVIVTINGIRK